MNDPRFSMTSASSALRDSLCAGAHLAQRGLADPDAPDARTGTMLHAAFGGDRELYEKLDRADRRCIDTGRKIEGECFRRWFQSVLTGADELTHKDADIQQRARRGLRLWAHHNSRPVHSGEVDALWFTSDMEHALIEDLKSLWGEQQDADEHLQLRDYAALVWENYQCKSVTVFINQPRVVGKAEKVQMVTYKEADLKRAHAEMIARVLASNDIGAKRTPGLKQCQFCKAAGTARCPESIKTMYAGLPRAPFDDITPAERAASYVAVKNQEKLVKKFLADFKEWMAANPGGVAGYEIGEGRKTRELADVIGAGAILSDLYPDKFATDDLMRCCKLSLPKLEELFIGMRGSDEGAFAEFNNLFGHLIVEGRTEGSIQKVKEK